MIFSARRASTRCRSARNSHTLLSPRAEKGKDVLLRLITVYHNERKQNMDWELHSVYLPAREMNSALQFYRDQVGLEEVWREGDLAIAFQLPGTTVQLI